MAQPNAAERALAARLQQQYRGTAPVSGHDDSGLFHKLMNVLGVTAVQNFTQHPGLGTGLEAAASLPLPAGKALRGSELLARLLENTPRAARLLGGGAARGFVASGNTAVGVNALQHPDRQSLLTALAVLTPESEHNALLRDLARSVKGSAQIDATAHNAHSAGGFTNTIGSFPLRREEDVQAVAQLLDHMDRAQAINAVAGRGTRGGLPVAHPLLRLLMGGGQTTAPGYLGGNE